MDKKKKSKGKKTATKSSKKGTPARKKSTNKSEKSNASPDKNSSFVNEAKNDNDQTDLSNINKSALLIELDQNRMNREQNRNTGFKEKCDGCMQEKDDLQFCTDCNKMFCKNCEQIIHGIPSYALHKRTPLNNMQHLKKYCFHHNAPLRLFCETCEEPICQECQFVGPHNNKLHKINTVFDSYKEKLQYISAIVNKDLKRRYDTIVNQVTAIDTFSSQVKSIKLKIERNIRAEYSKMMDELNDLEGKKLAVLNYDSTILQKDLTVLEEIEGYIYDLESSESPDMISFLLRYKGLNSKIENEITKPIKTDIDVSLTDFPDRLEENHKKMEKIEHYEKVNKLKNEIIWKMENDMNKKEQLQQQSEREKNEIKEKSKYEIEELVKISDKYAAELQKYNLVCYFCGCFLDESTVNSPCEKNFPSETGQITNEEDKKDENNTEQVNLQEEQGFTFATQRPGEEFRGTKRHYFSPPTKEFMETINKKKKGTNPFEKNIFNEVNSKNTNS
ncbi:MAG: hypothetical protein MJ252_20740 [archaeon]|nr:hypothetical protein [archaeon]